MRPNLAQLVLHGLMLLKLRVALQHLPQILAAVEQTGLLAHLLAQALTVGKEHLPQGTVLYDSLKTEPD
jgi:hypothetical protein